MHLQEYNYKIIRASLDFELDARKDYSFKFIVAVASRIVTLSYITLWQI